MRCFQGVSVDFPAGASAYHSKELWQTTSWIHWSQGELRIDTASFAIVFCPTGCGSLAAKPLGCLTSASLIPPSEPGGLATFVAATNDPVHGLLRMNFQSLTDEEGFVAIAHAAETSSGGRFPGCAGRRSSLSRRSSVCPGASGDGLSEVMRSRINEQFMGIWPLIHGVAELYGPDPNGEQGSEVLLGRGAVVMLDAQDASRVGSYELLFFDEGYVAPLLRLPISPRLRLTQLNNALAGGANSQHRQSMDNMRPSFELTTLGGGPWGLVFDLEVDAAAFARDYVVRQRLVALSLKTSRGWRTVYELQDEISEMRRRGIFVTAQRLLYQSIVLIFISLFVYTCVLYSSDPYRPILDVAVSAISDALSASFSFTGWVADASTSVCGLFMRAVPTSELQRCMSFPDAIDMRSCTAVLMGSSMWG